MAHQSLPDGFAELEPFVDEWAKANRNDRYAVRLSKSIAEIGEFYDAIAARAEDAMVHLDGFDLGSLPEPETRLLQLLYSMVLVSYAVNVFKQPHIPDSGSAFFDQVIEPAV